MVRQSIEQGENDTYKAAQDIAQTTFTCGITRILLCSLLHLLGLMEGYIIHRFSLHESSRSLREG
jgi:hypothetical protein